LQNYNWGSWLGNYPVSISPRASIILSERLSSEHSGKYRKSNSYYQTTSTSLHTAPNLALTNHPVIGRYTRRKQIWDTSSGRCDSLFPKIKSKILYNIMSSPVQFSRYTPISHWVTRLPVLLSLKMIKRVVRCRQHTVHSSAPLSSNRQGINAWQKLQHALM
jgi:hypothetical protein